MKISKLTFNSWYFRNALVRASYRNPIESDDSYSLLDS